MYIVQSTIIIIFIQFKAFDLGFSWAWVSLFIPLPTYLLSSSLSLLFLTLGMMAQGIEKMKERAVG